MQKYSSRPTSKPIEVVLDCLDLTAEILTYVPTHAIFPVRLSCKRFNQASVRVVGDKGFHSSVKHFVCSISLLQWGIASGCPTKHMCVMAAAAGQTKVLYWLRHEHNPPYHWDERAVLAAIKFEQIKVLQWLRCCNSPPCPWGTDSCELAVRIGNLEILKWLREVCLPPCPWNEPRCRAIALEQQHDDIINWFLKI